MTGGVGNLCIKKIKLSDRRAAKGYRAICNQCAGCCRRANAYGIPIDSCAGFVKKKVIIIKQNT